MLKIVRQFLSDYFQRQQDFRVRLFEILAAAGVLICGVMAVVGAVTGSAANVLFNTALMLVSGGLLFYARKSGNYKFCYLMTIIIIFLVGFPLLFFVNGGYYGGMPSFFIFAIVFTALMLDKATAKVIIPLELLLYCGLCVFAYMFPEYIRFFDSEAAVLTDVLVGLIASGAACGICIYLHLREYDVQQVKLSQQNDRLERNNAAKSTFLTTVAHEVKNPLTAISVIAHDASELLDETPQDEQLIKGNLRSIERIVVRIDRILIDLMDTVSIEQGRLTLSLAPINLDEVLSEAVATLSGDIKAKNNTVVWKTDDVKPIIADYARLLQVVINLLSNAVKYTRNGTLTLTLTESENHQTVTVSDTGEGMTEKIKSQVFKGYVSVSEDYWRHGIGLYISHQIVTAHGGSIAIDSMEGKGTSVSFSLPHGEL